MRKVTIITGIAIGLITSLFATGCVIGGGILPDPPPTSTTVDGLMPVIEDDNQDDDFENPEYDA